MAKVRNVAAVSADADVMGDLPAPEAVADVTPEVAPVLVRSTAAPEHFDVAFNIVKVLPAYWNRDPEAVKRAVREWQEQGIVPEGLA